MAVDTAAATRPDRVIAAHRGVAARRRSVFAWVAAHRASLVTLLPVLAIGGTIRLWNLSGAHIISDDEGTYVAQAWAFLHGEWAHYTYWYDHPPFGWMQIAAWIWLTDALARVDSTVLAVRELVAVYAIVAAALLFVLCRRLGVRRVFAAVGTALFLVSPLALSWGRQGFLDGLCLPWLFGAMLCARSAKANRGALAAALCLAGAVLTKETSGIFVPFVLWMVWQNSERRDRVRNVVQSAVLFAAICAFTYVGLAALKGELFPGEGHVSLLGSLKWQVLDRGGGGSILEVGSETWKTSQQWFAVDWLLLAFGGVLLPVAALRDVFRPVAAVALLHVILTFRRDGYTPQPYVIVVLALAALLIALGLDVIWPATQRGVARSGDLLRRGVVVALILGFGALVAPSWSGKLADALTDDGLASFREAVAWIDTTAPPASGVQIISDDEIWLDLVRAGYARDHVDWWYKLDVDPEVMERYVPQGGTVSMAWESIDYVIIPRIYISDAMIAGRPTLEAALAHSTLVQQFGVVTIYRVDHP